MVARAAIGNYQGECDYVADPDRVEVTLILPIVAERGPASDGAVTVDYFVSVIDPDARVLAKEVFSTEIEFRNRRRPRRLDRGTGPAHPVAEPGPWARATASSSASS